MEAITLQNLFLQAVLEKDSFSIEKLSQHIKAPNNLTPAESLAIYHNNVVGNLSNTLVSIYPVCCQLLGEKFFNATGLKFIEKFPCLSPDLGDYGEEFADFLANFEPVKDLPYLSDVARLEWHWHRIFAGENTNGLDFQTLGEIPQEKWGELIFYLPKNSVLLESIYPIHRIWQVNQSDYQGDEVVSLDEGGVKIFLWRQGYDMRIDLPKDDEWELLTVFQGNYPVEIICEKLVDVESEVDVGLLLPLFVQRGWITNFSIVGVGFN
ncbi:DNA-binding domain-containing protein [Okeania sp.]|uniref:DNA-binding domain-containing protein n=1 Tax=Okeania sp. TaxID=3100323 RepID=UPI002B4AD60E|nr:DNA-binding domain-containing protein [Okeania sp.]MEB3340826.1 DNA-binding domain-containing protein [Okeania sp.]